MAVSYWLMLKKDGIFSQLVLVLHYIHTTHIAHGLPDEALEGQRQQRPAATALKDQLICIHSHILKLRV